MLALAFGCATDHSSANTQAARTLKANPTDVDTIAHILQTDYECLSGPAGVWRKVRQKERDDTLYIPGVLFVSLSEEKGQIKSEILTQDEYWGGMDAYKKKIPAVYETEVGRRIERFGNIAQVRSVTVGRGTPDGPVTSRYVNYCHLYWDGHRWWIAGEIWQPESPTMPIPESWIGKWEEVTH
jgi:hypothetical protein